MAETLTLTNGESTTIVIGAPVYPSAASTARLAKADALSTSRVVGLVQDATIAASASGTVLTDGPLTLTTGQWDAVAGTTGGLTAGSVYYVSTATAGRITSTQPTTGNYIVEVGVAVSATTLLVKVRAPELSETAATSSARLAANALTTIAAVHNVVGTGYFSEALIAQRIAQVSQDVISALGRDPAVTVVSTTTPESYKGNGMTLLPLNRRPIVAVSQVLLDGMEIVDWEQDPDRDEKGLLYRMNLWRRAAARFNDVTQDADSNLLGYNIQVAYEAGWVLPQYVQDAILVSARSVTNLTSTQNLAVGMVVTGTGVAANTTIASISSATALTLSKDITASGATVLTFHPVGASGSAEQLPADLEGVVVDVVVRKLSQPLSGLEQQKTVAGDYQKWAARHGTFFFEELETIARYSEKYR